MEWVSGWPQSEQSGETDDNLVTRFLGLVRTDQITVLEVVAVELVAGLLGIHYVLIDNKGRPLRGVGDTLTNLAKTEVSILIGFRNRDCRCKHTEWDRIFQKGRKAPLE